MGLGECDICGEKANLSTCEKHYLCGDCGKTRKECEELGVSLVHRCEGLICNVCWAERMNKKMKEFDGDTDYTDEIRCPHCGHEFGDSWEYNGDDGRKMSCDDCNNEFKLSVDFDVHYSTEKITEEKA